MQRRTNFWRSPINKMAMAAAAVATLSTLLGGTLLSGELVVWLNTTGNGAAGSSYYNLEFTNLSAHSCTLIGYPGVSALGVSGQQLGSSAGRNAEHTDQLITLSSGASDADLHGFLTGNTATVILQVTDAGNYPNSTCGRVASAGLRVYPPNQTVSKSIPFPFTACSKRGPLFLHVESVQKGVTGQ
jgi:Protein of unknown function (DUF4232)